MRETADKIGIHVGALFRIFSQEDIHLSIFLHEEYQ